MYLHKKWSLKGLQVAIDCVIGNHDDGKHMYALLPIYSRLVNICK